MLVVVAAVVAGVVVHRARHEPAARPSSGSSVLALTWGPSLCAADPSNKGCRTGHVAGLGKSFVLHGLWPQPSSEQYCELPKSQAGRAKAPELPADLRATLQQTMSDSTMLAPHEWFAHGTCSGVTAPEYFGIATRLAKQAKEVLDPVFGQSVGERLSSRSVRDAFDSALGSGAGQRVGLTCRRAAGSDIVYEVRLSLPSVVDLRDAGDLLSLRQSLAAGPAVPPGCGRAAVP